MKNIIIRLILDLGPRAHISTIEYKRVNMLPVSYRVKQLKLNHVFNIYNDQCPLYLKENFLKISDTLISLCTKASRNNFFLQRIRNQAVNSFYFSGIKEWNSLPSKLKEKTDLVTFKLLVKDNFHANLCIMFEILSIDTHFAFFPI